MPTIFTASMVGESTHSSTNVITCQTPYGNISLSKRWIREVCIHKEQLVTGTLANWTLQTLPWM